MILASGSPRRRQMLTQAGFEFEVIVPDVDESAFGFDPDNPGRLAEELAQAKAEAVAVNRPGDVVLAGDTIVVLGDRLMGKPVDRAEAIDMLTSLSGVSHQVITGYCLARSGRAEPPCSTVTEVVFRNLALAEVERYVQTGSPMDKAGAYGIQDMGGGLVKKIKGSYTNVVGLPLAQVIEALARLGLFPKSNGGSSGRSL